MSPPQGELSYPLRVGDVVEISTISGPVSGVCRLPRLALVRGVG